MKKISSNFELCNPEKKELEIYKIENSQDNEKQSNEESHSNGKWETANHRNKTIISR